MVSSLLNLTLFVKIYVIGFYQIINEEFYSAHGSREVVIIVFYGSGALYYKYTDRLVVNITMQYTGRLVVNITIQYTGRLEVNITMQYTGRLVVIITIQYTGRLVVNNKIRLS